MFTSKVDTKAKIMIIDDDRDINNLFKIYLEHNGYSVNSYTDFVEALNYFEKDMYDLIIIDLKMRKIDGQTLHKKLREIDENISICIATADQYYVQKLKNSNPDIEKIVIYKPILLEELKKKVEAVLSKHEYNNYFN
ncbi:MAG: response regulator [Nitrososphaeraceae archaeon]